MSDAPRETKRGLQPSILSAQSLIVRPESWFLLAASLGVLLAAPLCAAGRYREATVVALGAVIVGFVLLTRISISAILVAWFALTPVASYFIRLPIDKSIITFNRGALALAAIALLVSARAALRANVHSQEKGERTTGISAGLRTTPFELAWAVVAAAALASALLKSNEPGYAFRIAFDSFCLPLFVFRLTRGRLFSSANLSALALAAIGLSILLFAVGSIELVTGSDMFAYTGSELVRAGERRVNGPFSIDSSYAAICLMLFLFLRSAPQVLGVRFDKRARLLYEGGLAAAAIGSLLPMFRTVAVAFLICWIILERGARRTNAASIGKPLVAQWIIGLLIASAVLAATVAPTLLAPRISDPTNVLSRLATWEAATTLALENPLFGVGLANYRDAFRATYHWTSEPAERIMDAPALQNPHSNVLWITVELGGVASAFYLLANIYLAVMGFRMRRHARTDAQRSVVACWFSLVCAYWIVGLTLSSGLYSDLNLYFFFLLALLANRFERLALESG